MPFLRPDPVALIYGLRGDLINVDRLQTGRRVKRKWSRFRACAGTHDCYKEKQRKDCQFYVDTSVIFVPDKTSKPSFWKV